MKQYRVIGMERRGEMLLAAVLKTKDERAEVYLETGEKVAVSTEKNIWNFSPPIEANDEKTMKLALTGLRKKYSQEAVDLSMLWECLDDRNYDFSELLESYYGHGSQSHAGSLFVALSEDRCYFQLRGGKFFRTPQDKVESIRMQGEREKQKQAEEKLVIAWLKEGKSLENEYLRNAVEELKQYALCGEENSTPEGKRLVQMLNMDCDDLLILLEERGILPKDVNEMMHRCQIPLDFPLKALSETEDLIGREDDFRGRRILDGFWNVAIDDATTIEVDDAISYYEEDGCEVLGVHIADVAFAVPIASALDTFAAERFSTLYFPEGKVTLFPLPLIERKLTLASGVPRPTVSGFFYFENGVLVRWRFEETVTILSARATYEDTVQLKNQPQFARLYEIASSLRERRVEEGAIINDLPELRIHLEDGKVILQIIPPHNPGHLVVSEAMILFNEYLAKYLKENNIPAFFRVQLEKNNRVPVSSEDPLFHLKSRWGLKPASLSLTPALHATLGVAAYTQGTSPIRRYSDLILQRQLLAHLRRQTPPYSENDLGNIKMLLERGEKAAKTAEHGRFLFWLYKYLKQNKGKIYTGFVSRIFEDGRALVFLPDLLQEFPIRIEDSSDAEEGKEVQICLQAASPRKKKAHWTRRF